MKKLTRSILSLAFIMILSISLIGCSTAFNTTSGEVETTPPSTTYEEISLDDSPQAIKDLYEQNKTEEFYTVIEADGTHYALITMGEKSSGGYEIKFKEVNETENEIEISFEFISPNDGDIVTAVMSYPVLVVKLQQTDKEVTFHLVNKEEVEKKKEEEAKEQNDESSAILFETAEAGDKIGNMIVTKANIGEGTAMVEFEGTVTLKGTYHYDPEHEFVDGIWFNVAEESIVELPKWMKDERYIWFTFKNHDEAMSAFDVQDGSAEGTAIITIDEYSIRYAPTEIWNEAKLINVVEYEPQN